MSKDHISRQELESFAFGLLTQEESYQVSDHLAVCIRCRTDFADLAKTIAASKSAASLIESPSHPRSIGNYEHFERIAQGGMGVVYSAVIRGESRKVAIKCLSPDPNNAYSSDRKQRLMREAQALTRINHPNIVRAIEVILIGDAPALVLEHVNGEPMHRWIRSREIDFKTATALTLQLAKAIAHAHSKGVIHCDLKPQNVLVTYQGPLPDLKVVDFGLAKLTDHSWEITRTGELTGTPAYMAPEQTTGQPIPASASIDIYGLGTILYELLTGRPPFDDKDSTILVSKVASQPPRRPKELRPKVPITLDDVCMKCLEKSPKDRYESVELLAKDLQDFLDELPVKVKPVKLSRRLNQYFAKHRGLLIGLAIASLIGSLIGFQWLREYLLRTQVLSEMRSVEVDKQNALLNAQLAQAGALEELRLSLQETVEHLFGSTPEREEAEWNALTRMLQRWENFSEKLPDSRQGRLVQAESIMRIGSIHLALSDLDSAEQKLQIAIENLDELRRDSNLDWNLESLCCEAHSEFAKCLFEQGKVSQSENHFAKSLSFGRKSIQIHPTAPTPRYLLSKVHRDYGVLLTRIGRLPEARGELDHSIELLHNLRSEIQTEIPRDRILEQWWSTSTALAMMFKVQGQKDQAIQSLEKLPEELMDLVNRRAEDPTVLRLLSAHYYILGTSQLEAGKFQESKTALAQGIEYLNRLLSLYPRRQDMRKNYGGYLTTLAVCAVRLGRSQDALQYAHDAYQVQSELVADYQNRQEYQLEKSRSLTNLVAILASVHRLEEAQGLSGELLEIQRGLYYQHPEQSEYAYSLASSLVISGQLLTKLGQEDRAIRLLQEARQIYSVLVERFPNVAIYRNGLFNAINTLGDIATRCKDWDLAIEIYSDAIYTTCSRIPGVLQDSPGLTQAYLGQAVAFANRGEIDHSRACAQLGCDTIAPFANRDPRCKVLQQRCLELLEGTFH